jgi:hypothetical protein
MGEKEKTLEAAKGLSDFFNQFGNDIYSNIVLEVFFEELLNVETLHLSAEEGQKGHEADNNAESDKGVPSDPPPKPTDT